MELKLFGIVAWGIHAYGFAVVAAENPEQAASYAGQIDLGDDPWSIRYSTPMEIEELKGQYSGTPGVLFHYEDGE
jgi:hypothetical protein